MILSAVTSTAKDQDRNPRDICTTEETNTIERTDTTEKKKRPISEQEKYTSRLVEGASGRDGSEEGTGSEKICWTAIWLESHGQMQEAE